MEIKIIKPADNDQIKETIVRWQLAAKKNFTAIGFYCFLSGLYFLFGISVIRKSGTFWNIFTCVAVALLIVTVISLYGLYKGRKKWIARAKFYVDRQIKIQTQTEFIFNDNEFSSRDAEAYVEIKWSAFSHYKLYKNYIFLFLSHSEAGGIGFDSAKLSTVDLSTLMTFIKSKLSERR